MFATNFIGEFIPDEIRSLIVSYDVIADEYPKAASENVQEEIGMDNSNDFQKDQEHSENKTELQNNECEVNKDAPKPLIDEAKDEDNDKNIDDLEGKNNDKDRNEDEEKEENDNKNRIRSEEKDNKDDATPED